MTTPWSACHSSRTCDSDLAIAQIEDVGLEAEVKEQPSTEIEEGKVIDQNPEEGTRVEQGSTVTITVSTGPKEVEVPRIVGLTYEDAVDALNERQSRSAPGRRLLPEARRPGHGAGSGGGGAGRRGHRGGGARLQGRSGGRGSRRRRPVRVERALRTRGGRLRGGGNRGPERHGRRARRVPDPVCRQPGGRRIHGHDHRVHRARARDRSGRRRRAAIQRPGHDPECRPAAQRRLRGGHRPSQNNVVLGQDPGGGTQADSGSTVTIIVGRFSC